MISQQKIELVHIEPGRPVQNAHVESFHGKLRDECLNAGWFASLFEARAKIGAWKKEYNEERSHSSLGYLAPRGICATSCGAPVAHGSLHNANPESWLRQNSCSGDLGVV
jgi:transposase InsO family protein